VVSSALQQSLRFSSARRIFFSKELFNEQLRPLLVQVTGKYQFPTIDSIVNSKPTAKCGTPREKLEILWRVFQRVRD